MTNQKTADAYFERARELEDHAQRVEQVPNSDQARSDRGDATVLRREAAWWRAFAMSLAEAA